jgi:hypothetical protein
VAEGLGVAGVIAIKFRNFRIFSAGASVGRYFRRNHIALAMPGRCAPPQRASPRSGSPKRGATPQDTP